MTDSDIRQACLASRISHEQLSRAVARTSLLRMVAAPIALFLSVPVAKALGALPGIGLISVSILLVGQQVSGLWKLNRFVRAARRIRHDG